MNITDRYILENLDENIIVVTNGGAYSPSVDIKDIGKLEGGKSILLEKDSAKHFLRLYGSTWARIDYLHKVTSLAAQDVYGKPKYASYNFQLQNKGRYNGSYSNVSTTSRGE